MAWEIDYIKVKNNGLFAKWGYARVMADENGAVFVQNISGKQTFSLNLDQYPNIDRRYSVGQKITEYCNNETHTFYRIYAINERPFARVETDINQAKCGFEEPLPEPAVPSNPFGNPVYGLYRTFSYCDYEGQTVNVSIECKNYDGEVFPIQVGGRSPVVISRKEVDSKFTAIRPTECILSFTSTDNFLLEQFYTNDERTFRVTVEKKGVIEFKGYIIPDTCREPFEAPPYEVTIKATDTLGGLKSVTYPIPVGSTSLIQQSFIDILAYCFAMTNLNLDISTICNLYESTMPTGLNDDPLALASINPLRLSKDNGITLNVYEVLNEIATAWGAFIVQDKGCWNFVRPNELAAEKIRRRRYNYTGLFLYADYFTNTRVAGAAI